MAYNNDEATARALAGECYWGTPPRCPQPSPATGASLYCSNCGLAQRITVVLATSHAEGEGQVAAARAILDGVLLYSLPEEKQEAAVAFMRDTAAAAQVYTAAVTQDAARKERERCAVICDTVADDYVHGRCTPKWTAQEAARAIRALRDDGPEEG